MGSIDSYKKRFYSLMESQMGDVKPLINEQSISNFPITSEKPQKLPKEMFVQLTQVDEFGTAQETDVVFHSFKKSSDDTGCWFIGKIEGENEDSEFKWSWNDDTSLYKYHRKFDENGELEKTEYLIPISMASMLGQICEEGDLTTTTTTRKV